jgi:hypothetical protein
MGSSSGSNSESGSSRTSSSALPIALKVSFTLNTPDGLRQIFFELEKGVEGVKVNWTITFKLCERGDPQNPFGEPVVSLHVFVASTLHANAERAAQHGLTPPQTAHATGPAANAAIAAQAGTIPLPVCHKIIQDTLK